MSRKRIGRRSICSVRRLTAERCARPVAAAGIGRVNRLPDILSRVIPFFVRFPLVGTKARDSELFVEAAELLGKRVMSDADYQQVLLLREQMNRGGKRRYTAERILRDYTPSPFD